MNSIKVLFDSQALLADNEEEKVITLDRIAEIDPKPTITVKLSDEIREKQRELFNKFNRIVFRGNRKEQEAELKSKKTEYAKALVDLCVIDSTGLFEKHDKALLKRVFIRQSSFMDYVLSEITKVFDGSVKLAEEQEAEDEKN
jgi:uncharacterized sporulation protein YeaH/YhbH (DUF444 family)